ncbi:MAG TPA: MAPEG family protein [Kofleriaceae bacterium]|jgi:uncharacterized MAPEG superfamily protein|nr:MAPEG family protein [Kofleriaceae bacterium]
MVSPDPVLDPDDVRPGRRFRPKKRPGPRILFDPPIVIATMNVELLYLLLTALLTGVLWIPVVIGYVSSRGALTPAGYKKAPDTPLPDWVNRANRAHQNAVENFAPFAAVVLVAQALGISTPVTQASAAVYFYARVAHAVIHVSGFGRFRARTVLFSVAWIAFLVFAVVVLARAL